MRERTKDIIIGAATGSVVCAAGIAASVLAWSVAEARMRLIVREEIRAAGPVTHLPVAENTETNPYDPTSEEWPKWEAQFNR